MTLEDSVYNKSRDSSDAVVEYACWEAVIDSTEYAARNACRVYFHDAMSVSVVHISAYGSVNRSVNDYVRICMHALIKSYDT